MNTIDEKILLLESQLKQAKNQKEEEYDTMRMLHILPLFQEIDRSKMIDYDKITAETSLEEIESKLTVLLEKFPCITHEDVLIDEDVDKWWVNYKYRCKKCRRERTFRGCVGFFLEYCYHRVFLWFFLYYHCDP